MTSASSYHSQTLAPQHQISQQTSEAFSMAMEFISDIASPEGYGHAVSPEVVKRAARILAMLRPKAPVCERPTGIGYTEPPPARCQHCDES